MGKRENHRQDLQSQLDAFLQAGEKDGLYDYLLAHSNLPGQRANLELAAAFADLVEERAGHDRLPVLLDDMIALSAEEAPVNDPREFLPFCGAVGIGALGAIQAVFFEQALLLLRELARDPRWRMREAVCFGLQRMLTRRGPDTMAALNGWVEGGNLLELRAAAAGVAEPALLQDHELALAALQLHQRIVERVALAQERRSEPFRVLRKGLAYTLSVVVQARPKEGFALLSQLGQAQDPDLRWILRQNLNKNRLIKHFPEQVEALRQST